jgi:hypothetical protein
MRYLVATHGVEALGFPVPGPLEADEVLAGDRWDHQRYAAAATREIVEGVGLAYTGPRPRISREHFRFSDVSEDPVAIAGYGFKVPVSRGSSEFQVDGLSCSWSVSPSELWGEVRFPDGESVRFDLAPAIERARDHTIEDDPRFFITGESGPYRVMLHLRAMGGLVSGGKPILRSLSGDLYLDLP